MGLDIDMISAKKFFAPFNGQGFRDIDIFTSPIIPLRRITFSVLVGHDASLGLENRLTHKIFRGNQLQFSRLPAGFL